LGLPLLSGVFGMKRLFVGVCIAGALALSGSAFGQNEGGDAGDLPKAPARSDRLDIFGAGMCHQCEWRPRPKLMAAAEQCGEGADGKAKLAVFECGRNPACDNVCNFVRCETP